MPSEKDLRTFIATTRARHRLSQSEFGKRIGVAGPTIGTYERGEQPVPLKVREGLVTAFNVPAEEVGLVAPSAGVQKSDIAEFAAESFRLAVHFRDERPSKGTQSCAPLVVLQQIGRIAFGDE